MHSPARFFAVCVEGRYLNLLTSQCNFCPSNTYKTGLGNDIGLCLACPTDSTYSGVGATMQSQCGAYARGRTPRTHARIRTHAPTHIEFWAW